MGKKLAFWGDCNGYCYKIIRILEELGGINVSNYCGTEVTSLYYIDEKNRIKCTYNGDLDKEKYVVMTYRDFIAKYPHQVYDIVYTTNNHEEGKIVEIVWDETKERMRYLVDFENSTSWVFVDDIFSYEPKDNSKCGTAIKPMKVKSNAVKLVDGKVVDNSDEGKTMNKKLAIKGHPTRGKEVIELLKMMGGRDVGVLKGNHDYYVIDECENNLIKFYGHNYIRCHEFVVFTLEEFLEKYPFKVGDKVSALFQSDKKATNGFCSIATVTIKSMSWSEDCETMVYDFEETEDVLCAEDLEFVNDTDDHHTKPSKMKNVLAELLEHIKTTPKEELEREFEELEEWSNVGPTVEEFRTFCECVNKKPKYPDNYEECVRIAKNIHGYDIHIDTPAYGELMESFVKLLICRDAYWKIAGEEMGLGKPWEPDWLSGRKEEKYCIATQNNEIWHNFSEYGGNEILAFPTMEMRDTFYENFKDLIESCKELL